MVVCGVLAVTGSKSVASQRTSQFLMSVNSPEGVNPDPIVRKIPFSVNIYEARNKLQRIEEIPVTIPLSLGSLISDSAKEKYVAMGVRTPSGRFLSITPSMLDSMFSRAHHKTGLMHGHALSLNIIGHSIFDVEQSFQRVKSAQPTFDFIAIDSKTGETVIINEYSASLFFSDALNAIIKGTWLALDKERLSIIYSGSLP